MPKQKQWILYLFIYKKIKEKASRVLGSNPCATHALVREVLRRKFYFIPHNLHIIVLKEMEEMCLLRKIGTTNNIRYELMKDNVDKLINQQCFPYM